MCADAPLRLWGGWVVTGTACVQGAGGDGAVCADTPLRLWGGWVVTGAACVQGAGGTWPCVLTPR